MEEITFKEYNEKYPLIGELFLKFALELRKAGITNIRPLEIIHRIRWEILTNEGDFDALNGLRVLYANKYGMALITEEDSFRSFFDLTVRMDS